MTVRFSGGKTALVLAGGGIAGAVYEIGALRAIDDLLVDRTVNDFDIYVGTSAGALVSTFVANGISPEFLLQTMDKPGANVEPFRRESVFTVNYRDVARWGIGLPKKLVGAWSQYLLHINDMTLFDLFWSLSDVLPAGMYDGLALEHYLRNALVQQNKSNSFTELERELFIIATNLDSGERTVFGRGNHEDTPISLAVAASSALPILYKPVNIDGQDYVDGGLRGNASIDLAIEHGADLVVCINPLVPLYNRDRENSRKKRGLGEHLSQKGIQSIANQTLRITTHAVLHYHIKQLRRSNPQVDIILIEPTVEDYPLFLDNIMRYSVRLEVARYGFESATLNLAKDYAFYKQVLTRHGIPITRRLVIEEIREIQQSNYNHEVIRRVLEARKGPCGGRKFDTPICQLERVLSELEMTLDIREMGV